MLNSSRIPKSILGFSVILFFVGLGARLAPLFGGVDRIYQHFPTEDGYLMLTIARNIALGLGMSTADGTILTNGTQPLTTFVWTIGFLITGGDKLGGVVFAHLVLVVVSCLFAFTAYTLVKRVFYRWQHGSSAAIIVAALYFSSPQILPHTMNFLETGLYLAWATYIIVLFYPVAKEELLWSYRRSALVGVALGILFLIRIDSVFIIFSACLSYLSRGWFSDRLRMIEYLKRVMVFGCVSVVVGSPWLIYNYLGFGSIMPISGQALSAQTFAPNASVIPSTLLEYLLIILPIPNAVQENPMVILTSMVILSAALVTALYSFIKLTDKNYQALWVMGLTAVFCYVFYYGLFFGAKHFVARYLVITTPFLTLFMVMIALTLLRKVEYVRRPLLWSGATFCVLVIVALNLRIYQNAMPHQHIQVVNWVDKHVPDSTWVAAIQTGTLGYFHDRTINLDGKVNPDALLAKRGLAFCQGDRLVPGDEPKNCLIDYIIASKIDYLVDWDGIAGWMVIEPLADHFDLIVNQQKPTLAAIKRRGAQEKVSP